MFIWVGIVLTIVYLYAIYFIGSGSIKIFLTVFYISSIYYGVLGSWYWLEYRSGSFLGASWRDEVINISIVYGFVFFLVVLFSLYESRRSKRLVTRYQDVSGFDCSKLVLLVLMIVGALASLYVWVSASGLEKYELTQSSSLLILYQLSDVLIACLLFGLSSAKRQRLWFFLVALFLVYAVFTGLRYKIALVLGPVIVFYFFSENSSLRDKLILSLSLFFLVITFSVMTLARSKFSGIDLAVLSEVDTEALLYGLFAETNGLFALASAISQYGSELKFVYFEPVYEVFVQFVPRFLYPEKDLYSHLKDVAFGISLSEESVKSGTAPPFFGEYYVMFGWCGVVMGVFFYFIVLSWMIRQITKLSKSHRQMLIGIGLVSVYMGYYYYSRGSMAQISKGIVFIIIPYILMLRLQGIRSIRLF